MKKYKDSTRRWVLYQGDMQKVLKKIPENYYHSIVTDAPYHLTSITKRFGGKNAKSASKKNNDGSFNRLSKGFLNQSWDGGDVAFQKKTWQRCYKVLKPGGYLLAFGGTRTVHKLATAIESAGFEIVDQICYLYGTGFPKGQNISKAIDKIKGVKFSKSPASGVGFMGPNGPGGYNPTKNRLIREGKSCKESEYWKNYNTALKPSIEPIVVARKPLSEKTYALNVLKHGTGAFNIDACRIPLTGKIDPRLGGKGIFKTDKAGKAGHMKGMKGDVIGTSALGRYPANLIHDGSDEVMAEFAKYGMKKSGKPGTRRKAHKTNCMSGKLNVTGKQEVGFGDEGSVSRFFYCAKANKNDRAGSRHPTIKPQALMQYLVRLVTKPGGRVLDPFSGSGSTLQAATVQGFKATGIELMPDYVKDIKHRMNLVKDKNMQFKRKQKKVKK